jgi:hypothetical protein
MGMTINSQSTKLIQKLALSFLIDQDFPDDIGSDFSDLATAHSITVRLMKRVMMYSSFSDCAPDL